MIGGKSYASKAVDAAPRGESSLARAQRVLADHDAAKPVGDDAEALYVWRRERRDLEDRVSSAEEALAFARQAAERARVEAAEKAEAAETAAEEKAARAAIPLVQKVDALARQLAAARDDLAESVARTAAYNKTRGNRPAIVDAEARVRTVPAHTIPAVVEKRVIWRDANGDTPGAWSVGEGGEMVPAGHRVYTKRLEQIEMQGEQFIPARMPTRFSEALVLVDLAGNRL